MAELLHLLVIVLVALAAVGQARKEGIEGLGPGRPARRKGAR